MYPRGIIYQSGKSGLFGTILLHAPFKVRFLYAFLQTVGILLVGGSALYAAYCFMPAIKEEVVYAANQLQTEITPPVPTYFSAASYLNVVHDFTDAEKTIQVQKEAASYGVSSHFSVVVPKINARAEVVANVDTGREKNYLAALEEGVAHAQGTYFPGQGKLIYLFSHSTNSPLYAARYGAIFYLLNKMEVGDEVVVFFADKKYTYKVTQTLVVGPADTSWLKDKGEGETLILQTCTPTGTTLRRLLVIAKPV